jgi:hypothetical protein
LNRTEQLKIFALKHVDKPLSIEVNMERGFLLIINQNKEINFPSMEVVDKNNIRLIFFRRHFVVSNSQDMTNSTDTIIYFIGYQYTDDKGKNHKVILQLDEFGNIIVGG